VTPAGGKLLGTQLRMAAALQAYQRLDSRPQVLARLRALVLLLTAAAGDPVGTASGRDGDWALPDSSGCRAAAEVDFELCWHLAPLWQSAGWPVSMARQVQERRYGLISAQAGRINTVDAAARTVAFPSPEQPMVAALTHFAYSGGPDSWETFAALLGEVSIPLSSPAAPSAPGLALGPRDAGSREWPRPPGPFTAGRALLFAHQLVREMRAIDAGVTE
jgi:hypothetical protein